MYELKGLHITKYDMTASNSVKDVLNTPSDQQNCFRNHHCFAMALYSICYSIISPCGHWNSNTLDAIIRNESQLNNTMQSEHHLTSIYIPDRRGTNHNSDLKEKVEMDRSHPKETG